MFCKERTFVLETGPAPLHSFVEDLSFEAAISRSGLKWRWPACCFLCFCSAKYRAANPRLMVPKQYLTNS